MERQGTLIVIEGLDGSGKATQAEKLADWLRQTGQAVTAISFPDYSSQSSALVRMYLNGEIGGLDEVSAYGASLFYAADRYISYLSGWKKAYAAGHTIVADRYVTSNATYQMAKLPQEEWDDFLEWLYDNEFNRLKLPRPDLVIYLDVPPRLSRQLLEKRYGGDEAKKDLHERDLEYQLACREGALYAAEKLDWQVIRCSEGDEMRTVERIWEDVREIVSARAGLGQ